MICQWQEDPGDTAKTRYLAITEFNNCFIIRSLSFFLMNIFGKQSDLLFSCKSDGKKDKSVVVKHEQNIICSQTLKARHIWTTLRMSRPLFVGNYLQVTWWAFEEQVASNDNEAYCDT